MLGARRSIHKAMSCFLAWGQTVCVNCGLCLKKKAGRQRMQISPTCTIGETCFAGGFRPADHGHGAHDIDLCQRRGFIAGFANAGAQFASAAFCGSSWAGLAPSALQALQKKLASAAHQGRLALTFEVIYGHAFKASKVAKRDAPAVVSLDDMKKCCQPAEKPFECLAAQSLTAKGLLSSAASKLGVRPRHGSIATMIWLIE